MSSQHIVLLGDSIFDNAAYTAGAPDVISHLRAELPPASRASLLAVDGSTAKDLPRQIAKIPADATRLVISVGGNDALLNIDILDLPVRSTAEALRIFGQRADAFRTAYVAGLERALALGRPTTVCTIYEGNLEPEVAALGRVALVFFNDVIVRAAHERSIGILDLRLVCTEPSDYANPIEPSETGGLKIARAILGAVGI